MSRPDGVLLSYCIVRKGNTVTKKVENGQPANDAPVSVDLRRYVAIELGHEGLASHAAVEEYFNSLCAGEVVSAKQMLKYVSELVEQEKTKK